jgi:hypothetical protein
MRNGMNIQVLVQETSEDEVKFKKYDKPEGNIYSLNKWEIAAIAYANGGKEEFNVVEPTIKQRKEYLGHF